CASFYYGNYPYAMDYW
nr:immunoglobulin heavy chain junction region [Mus musculus]